VHWIGPTVVLLIAAAALALGIAAADLSPVIAAALGVLAIVVAIASVSVPMDKIAFFAVGALLLMITWNNLRFTGGSIANAFLVLSVAAVAGQALTERRPIPVPPWLFIAAVGFITAALLTYIFPPDHGLINEQLLNYRVTPRPVSEARTLFLTDPSNLEFLVLFMVAFLAIPVLIASVGTSRWRIDRLIDLWTLSAVVNSIVALVDFAGGVERSPGLTIHPNYLALTCAIAIPTALLWVSRGGGWRLPGLLAVALLLGGEFASGSRSGAVAAVLGLVATVVLLPGLRRAIGFVIPIVGVFAVAVVMFTSAGEEILSQLRLGGDELEQTVSTQGSDTQRDQLGDLASAQFRSSPVNGVGPSVIQDAHNIYLQLLAAAGVIGAASFLLFVLGVLGAALQARAGPFPDQASALAVAFLVWLANGLYTNQLADKYLYVIPGLLLAMSCVAGATVRTGTAVRATEPGPVGEGSLAGA
jgi:O-antigen ligase